MPLDQLPGEQPLFGYEDDARACRVCGCREHSACPDPRSPSGTCWWVEWDLCSACEAEEVDPLS